MAHYAKCLMCGAFAYWDIGAVPKCGTCGQNPVPLEVPDHAQLKKELLILQRKVRKQAENVTEMRLILEDKNRQLDMLHHVWCSGGCESGFKRFQEHLTSAEMDDLVKRAVSWSRRLALWWASRKVRKGFSMLQNP